MKIGRPLFLKNGRQIFVPGPGIISPPSPLLPILCQAVCPPSAIGSTGSTKKTPRAYCTRAKEQTLPCVYQFNRAMSSRIKEHSLIMVELLIKEKHRLRL
jgi:hypothetical protein